MRRETPRQILARRALERCEWCGQAEGREVHHRKFRSRQGGDGLGNLVLLCGFGNTSGCHGRAHTEAAEATRLGFTVPSWGDPTSTPVFLAAWRLWALLQDDGDFVFTDPPA